MWARRVSSEWGKAHGSRLGLLAAVLARALESALNGRLSVEHQTAENEAAESRADERRQARLASAVPLDTLKGKPSGADLHAALAKHYAGSRYVSVMPMEATKSGKLEPEALNETNKLELYVFASDKHRQAVLVARLDNLGKGASGAAVQNMRLMLGLPEG